MSARARSSKSCVSSARAVVLAFKEGGGTIAGALVLVAACGERTLDVCVMGSPLVGPLRGSACWTVDSDLGSVCGSAEPLRLAGVTEETECIDDAISFTIIPRHRRIVAYAIAAMT